MEEKTIMENLRKYHKNECISFLSTKEKFGGFSNMAAGFPIKIPNPSSLTFHTSEALYQAARFPEKPLLQQMIAKEPSPMMAKRNTREFLKEGRQDWHQVKIPIMRWCLQAKLVCNWNKFANLLMSTNKLPIVEISYKDQFWGAKPDGDYFIGQNILGRLLMELREKIPNEKGLQTLKPLELENFIFFGSPPPILSPKIYTLKELEADGPPIS